MRLIITILFLHSVQLLICVTREAIVLQRLGC